MGTLRLASRLELANNCRLPPLLVVCGGLAKACGECEAEWPTGEQESELPKAPLA